METTTETAEESIFSVTFSQSELLAMGGCGVVLLIGLAILLVYLSRRGHEQLMGGAEEFERTILSELTPAPPSPLPNMAPDQAPVAAGPIAAAAPPAPPSGPGGSQTMDALVQRLRVMDLLGEFQGSLTLGFGPDAQIYALKGGGTVLVLPRMESEAFLSHATRTHTMVVAPTSDGGALVVTPLGQSLSVSMRHEERTL